MRRPEYVQDLVGALGPRLARAEAEAAVKELHQTLQMFLCISGFGEEDHGTSKHFRLDNTACAWDQKYLNPVRNNSSSQQREEDGQALYEYSRQGNLAEVQALLPKVHPDEYA